MNNPEPPKIKVLGVIIVIVISAILLFLMLSTCGQPSLEEMDMYRR